MVFPPPRGAAGRWSSLPPSSPSPLPAGVQGSSSRVVLNCPCGSLKNALLALRSCSEPSSHPGFPLPDSPGIRPASHRWRAACSPLHRRSGSESTPANALANVASASWMPSMLHVPLSWFRTTSAGSSSVPASGLLHPDTDPGVHRVSSTMAFPAMQVRTPRRIFLLQSRVASLQPLPPCRFDDFVALLPVGVWNLAARLKAQPDPVLPGLGSPSRSFGVFAASRGEESHRRCLESNQPKLESESGRIASSVPHPR